MENITHFLLWYFYVWKLFKGRHRGDYFYYSKAKDMNFSTLLWKHTHGQNTEIFKTCKVIRSYDVCKVIYKETISEGATRKRTGETVNNCGILWFWFNFYLEFWNLAGSYFDLIFYGVDRDRRIQPWYLTRKLF